ncbi:MAG: AAA family ATPase [Muribaculaceae bacterium]|nr:AAA family ATPase [Roseburia sp.]MCM1430168.1 AAA family ATPase [Muribaculaceae bacterium]MCM1493098.1 AAA family ATPase [Muribaculaceae bacterium]
MIHNNGVLDKTVETAMKFAEEYTGLELYIVQNVYGKIIVYMDTSRKELVAQLEQELRAAIDVWLNSCESIEENYFAKEEIEIWKQESTPVRERVWIFEKYITNVYWDAKRRKKEKCALSSKLVSFYSFKGGVGRTTTMMMSAIGAARRGKRVAILDFDLEAPGVSSFFPEDALSQYGILDFLVESNVYQEEINIDEYLYPVGEYCNVNQYGGEIYILPAVGTAVKNDIEVYRKNLMRFDMDVPAYEEEKTPIDILLSKIDLFLKPDYIFIDTRSGIHQIGGITLTRYSDLALLFFYGSRQNIEGMQMTLPILKSSGTPFLLINSKVPVNESLAQIEKKMYIDGAYHALRNCDKGYQAEEILVEDETAEHYPIHITYNAALEVIASTEQLLKGYEEQETEYGRLVNVIEDTLQNDPADATVTVGTDNAKKIASAFSKIMGGLETAAAEDEFATEKDLQNNFYPLKSYTFIFDQRKFLVLGQKGVGKTALFSALKNNEYAKALAKYLNVTTEQYEHTEWIAGTSQATNYVDEFSCLKNEEQIRAFLYYETLRILLKNDSNLSCIISDSPVGSIFNDVSAAKLYSEWSGETAYQMKKVLEKVDQYYKEKTTVVTIIYDALDRIVAPKKRGEFVSALIDMWYKNETAMQNVRSRIFLRKDIYDREVNVPDKVKLKNYSVTIAWDYDQLFAMIWKRAISISDDVKSLYEKIALKQISKVDGLGYIPNVDEVDNRRMLSALIGVKMGSGNKASTYNWFKNRLSDTQGVIVPRSMIDIFAKAADKETGSQKEGNQTIGKGIIRPRCFEDVLPEVSEKRVIDLKEEFQEYAAFLDSLKDTVRRSPVDEGILQDALRRCDFSNPMEEILNLINIGILRRYQLRLSDPIRYHFPDIYLRGLGLQRSGMR